MCCSCVPGAGILAGEELLTYSTLKPQPRVRIHVSFHLVGREELLAADVTLEEPLARVHIVVASEVAQPLKGFGALGTEVCQLAPHKSSRHITLLPDVLPLETDVVVQTVLVAIVLSALLTA